VSSPQWSSLETTKNASADWPTDAVVALIEWLPNLTKTTMPMAIREFLIRDSKASPKPPLDVTSTKELSELDDTILTQLVQWSDLIIFDYLTGNYDRVASMQVFHLTLR
jgi:four-jointed box protein 1